MKKIIFLFLLVSLQAQAATCKRLMDCVTEASRLTGVKYIFPENMFKQQEMNVELILDEKNADAVLSEALAMFEYMKVPTKVEKVWQIISARDIRYHADLPTYKASKKTHPELPQNQDPIYLEYQASPGTDVGNIARNLRPFLSRYGRVIDMRSGLIVVMDRSSSVGKVLSMIQASDVPLSNAEKLRQEKERQREHELELARLKAGIDSRPPMPVKSAN